MEEISPWKKLPGFPMPLSLSDEELAAVMSAAKPLPARDRPAFLEDVASELAQYPEIGLGVIGRVTARLQREHLIRPRYRNGVGKWR